MKLWKTLGRVAVIVAALGMITPNLAMAEGAQAPKVLDVSLKSGTLQGQLLTSEGTPIRGETVSISKNGQEVARATTDAKGVYSAEGLSTGMYQVATSQGAASYRVWSENTAPPSAQAGALMVIGQPVRGQLGGGGLLTNPWVLGGIAATAIIVPLALDDDNGS